MKQWGPVSFNVRAVTIEARRAACALASGTVADREIRAGGRRRGLGAVHPAGVQGAEFPLSCLGAKSPDAAVLMHSV